MSGVRACISFVRLVLLDMSGLDVRCPDLGSLCDLMSGTLLSGTPLSGTLSGPLLWAVFERLSDPLSFWVTPSPFVRV